MGKTTSRNRKLALTFAAVATLGLSGCTSIGGGVNLSENSLNELSPFCQSLTTLERRVSKVSEGMSISEGFSILAQKDYTKYKSDLDKFLQPLDREGIFDTLYPSSSRLQGDLSVLEENRNFMKPLNGKSFSCTLLKEKGGLTSSGMQSTTKGYNYIVNMVFKDGKFFDKPIISGGHINDRENEHYLKMITGGVRRNIDNRISNTK